MSNFREMAPDWLSEKVSNFAEIIEFPNFMDNDIIREIIKAFIKSHNLNNSRK